MTVHSKFNLYRAIKQSLHLTAEGQSEGTRSAPAVIPGASFDAKFKNFSILQANYKSVGRHGIRADIVVPNSLPAGRHPVIIRFHGGGLIIGESLFPDWFPHWLLQLAEKHSAIIISANYRLLPESTGLDTLEDVEDLWTWVHSSKPVRILAALPQVVEPDLNRILTVGDSAGGLLSLSLALSHPDEIRAALGAYPLIDIDDPAFAAGSSTQLFSLSSDSVIGQHLRSVKPGGIATSASPPSRLALFAAVIQHGKFPDFYRRGSENSPHQDRLYLLRRMEQPGARLPRGGIVIMHGTEDDLVPSAGSEKFIVKAREIMQGKPGHDKIVLTLQPGGHGFDGNMRLTDRWLSDALRGAVETWLE